MGYDYFGFKTLEKSYLLRINNKITERPSHMSGLPFYSILSFQVEGGVCTSDPIDPLFYDLSFDSGSFEVQE